jgi:hypothetical protein
MVRGFSGMISFEVKGGVEAGELLVGNSNKTKFKKERN